MSCNYCLFFVAGLLVVFGYDDISHNKIATQSHTFAAVGYDASNAVDGNTATCMRADAIGPTSPHKTFWWKVDLGGVFSIYRINILFKNYQDFDMRQRGRFAGFSVFVSKTGDIQGTTLCYKNGPQLPPLNFTSTCTESGRYVIFYNERLDGVTYPDAYEISIVYTELCEVTVQGCYNASVYGINCDTPCPTNCKDSTCHIQSGACFNCKPGWTGMNCNTKCKEGWYGDNCTKQCVGHCKDGTTCNHVTGLCDGGCDAGWTGYVCDKECIDGTYGYNCINNCSGHCLNNTLCNRQTGRCDGGCKPGYTNSICNKVCSPGHYGMDCRENCSGHCINNEPCDHVSGACSRGSCSKGYFGTDCSRECSPNCKPDTCLHTNGSCTVCAAGWMGYNCTTACSKGYFGKGCSRECSPNCRLDSCLHTDGSCTVCAAGWTGYNCTTACVQSYGGNCKYLCVPHCYNQTCDRFNGRCLLGCQDGFYGEMCERGTTENRLIKQDISNCISLIIGLSISILINLILIGCGILLSRRIKPSNKTITSSVLFCRKKSIYQDTFVKNDEVSTYQELDLSGSVYRNTTRR